MELSTILITQARTGSTRLPQKVLKKVKGKELLRIHLERLDKVKNVDKIIVATTTEEEDEKIVNIVSKLAVDYYKGSKNDVLDRYYQAIICSGVLPTWVVRVTSDNPLIDPLLIDEVVDFAHKSDVDYISNGLKEEFPDGQDIEVFKFEALQIAWERATLPSEREHVTPFIRKNSDFYNGTIFRAKNFGSPKNYSRIRMTVDEEKDFILIENLIDALGTEQDWLTYTNYIIDNNLVEINGSIIRNEGYLNSIKKEKKNE